MTEAKLLRLLQVTISLLVINLAATGYLIFSTLPGSKSTTLPAAPAKHDVPKDKAMALARIVVDKYNANDVASLYAQFDTLAKMQFSQEQLIESVKKLKLFASQVDDFTYSHAELAGKQGGKEFLTLIYKARLSGGSFPQGEIKLNVVYEEGRLALFGFFLFALAK